MHRLPSVAAILCFVGVSGHAGQGACPSEQEKEAKVVLRFRELADKGWTPWTELVPGDQPAAGVYRHSSGITCRESLIVGNNFVRHDFLLTNESRTNPERLLTFAVTLPVAPGPDAVWDDDLYRRRVISGTTEFSHTVTAASIASPDGGLNTSTFGGKGNGGYGDAVGTGAMSPYPFACVSDGTSGTAIAVDIGIPVPFRLLYRPRDGLVAEFDLALSPSPQRSPNQASVSVLTYAVDSRWGFRSAAARYYQLFPRYYVRRLVREGIWMPFTPVNEVEQWEDFGFAIHETHRDTRTVLNNTTMRVAEADRNIGVTSFQYTEPWDIQVPVSPEGLAYDSVGIVARRHADYGEQIARSGAFDEDGQWIARLISAPWFSPPWAISYTTCAAPDASDQSRYRGVRSGEIDPALDEGFDGIYFDSLEFFWHYDLNYRQDHITATEYPLTFSVGAARPRPALWNYQSQYAMLKRVCEELHGRGKLSMGNGYTWIPFAVSQLDILGTEFSWFMAADEKQRVSSFRRTSCGQKPVVLLLNEGLYSDDFVKAPYEGYRQYFEESLFYGFYPSFFSADASNNPYWKRPDAYNVGRPFFKKYIPLIVEINRQGWQPVTLATVSDSRVKIERFAREGADDVYFTIRNFSDARVSHLTIRLDDEIVPRGAVGKVEELVHGVTVERTDAQTLGMEVRGKTTYLLKCSMVRR